MSQQLIDHSPDLKRLRDEGHDVRVIANNLVVGSVPYVTPSKEVKLGTIVSELTVEGDVAIKPGNHVVYFAGELPSDQHGAPLTKVVINSEAKDFGHGVVTQHTFSSKPADGYPDYYQKITTYIAILLTHAQAIDASANPRSFKPISTTETESVFHYFDSASSRADIGAVTAKLEGHKLAIVGLGGTGSYVLDLIAKVPALEIHLFDGDRFHQHNAFRSPGAASIEDIKAAKWKVDYFAEIYSRMHRHVIPHPVYVDETNVNALLGMSHVFFCLDKNRVKPGLFNALAEAGISFIDVGMGVQLVDGALLGLVRTTTSTSEMREHVPNHVSFADDEFENVYSKNIQIADLNMLSATLAVIKWKKLRGFFHDLDREHQSLYVISGNAMMNTEKS